MSTNAAVRTAWSTNVFTPLGVNSYDYLIDPDSQTDLAKGVDTTSKQVNFITYIVKSSELPGMAGLNTLKFSVEVTRIIEDDTTGANVKTLLDDFRTMIDYINDDLGVTWDNTIHVSESYPDALDIVPEITTWGGRKCWRAQINFTGLKLVNN